MQVAIFGLAGVIVGAVLSWLGTIWSDRRKQRHEGRVLVRGEKLEAYSEFASATKEYIAILYRVAAGRGLDTQTEKVTLTAAEPALVEAFRARDKAFERVRLVGSDKSMTLAREWVQAVYGMRNYLSATSSDASGWAALVNQANVSRDAFHAQAREELALT